MKFEQTLNESQYSPWKDHYVQYKLLKAHLKKISLVKIELSSRHPDRTVTIVPPTLTKIGCHMKTSPETCPTLSPSSSGSYDNMPSLGGFGSESLHLDLSAPLKSSSKNLALDQILDKMEDSPRVHDSDTPDLSLRNNLKRKEKTCAANEVDLSLFTLQALDDPTFLPGLSSDQLQFVLDSLEREFFHLLDNNVLRINTHYQNMSEETAKLEAEVQDLAKRVDSPSEQAKVMKQYEQLNQHNDLVRDYVELNYTAFLKIIKKHDKIAETYTLGPYMQLVHQQPFYLMIDRSVPYTQSTSKAYRLRGLARAGDHNALRLELQTGAPIDSVDKFGTSALIDACKAGWVKCVQLLLLNKANVNHHDHYGITALLSAAKNGQFETCRLLLQYKANVESESETGNNAISYAADAGHASVVELLLKHGAYVDHCNKDGETPLLMAASQGHTDVVDVLLQHNAKCDITNNSNETPLSLTASYSHLACLKLLLTKGKHVFANMLPHTNGNLPTSALPLISACVYGRLEALSLLVPALLDYERRYNNKYKRMVAQSTRSTRSKSVSANAVKLSDLETINEDILEVSEVVESSDDDDVNDDIEVNLSYPPISVLDWRDQYGCSALHRACEYGHIQCVKLLVAQGADVNLVRTGSLRSVKDRSAVWKDMLKEKEKEREKEREKEKGSSIVAGFSIEPAASPSLIPSSKSSVPPPTPLPTPHLTLVRSNTNTNSNSNPNVYSDSQSISLHPSNFETLDAFYQYMRLNYDGDLASPLIIASINGNTKAVKLLLNHPDIDIDYQSSDGSTALIWAVERGHGSVVAALLARGANTEIKNNFGQTALVRTSVWNTNTWCNDKALSLLLEYKAETNVQSHNGSTALIIACTRNHPECVRKLLSVGVDANISDNEGCSALHKACMWGNVECVKALLNHTYCEDSKSSSGECSHKEDGDDEDKVLNLHTHSRSDAVNLNMTDKNGRTPFMMAVIGNHYEVSSLLLEAHVDLSLRDNNGNSARDLAIAFNRSNITRLIDCEVSHSTPFLPLPLTNTTSNLLSLANVNSFLSLGSLSQSHSDLKSVHFPLKTLEDCPDLRRAAGDGHVTLLNQILMRNEGKLPGVGLGYYVRSSSQLVDYSQLIRQSCHCVFHHPHSEDSDSESDNNTPSVCNVFSDLNTNKSLTELVSHLMYPPTEHNANCKQYQHNQYRRYVDLPDQFGASALILAARHGKFKCLKHLLTTSVCADVNVYNMYGNTALMSATKRGYLKCVQLLLDHKSCVWMVDESGNSALHLAMERGVGKMLKLLLRQVKKEVLERVCGDSDVRESQDSVVSHSVSGTVDGEHAVLRSDPSSTGVALTMTDSGDVDHHDADIDNHVDELIPGVGIGGAGKGFQKPLSSLLDDDSDVECSDDETDPLPLYLNTDSSPAPDTHTLDLPPASSPVQHPHQHQHQHQVSSLVTKAVTTYLNMRNAHGMTSLALAAANGHINAVHLLLKAKADPNIANSQHDTPLIHACMNGHVKVTQLLLAYGSRDSTEGDVLTPLTAAAMNGHIRCVKHLLFNGANIDGKDGHGSTALIRASQNGHHDVVCELLAAKANVNTLGESGTTALIVSSLKGHDSITEELLKAKAHINIRGEGGATALLHASDKGHTRCVELLLQHKALTEVANIHGHTPLIRTLYWNNNTWDNKAVLELLLAHHAKINAVAEHGNTAMHIASFRGFHEAVQLLIKSKAYVDFQNREGITPLFRAAAWGNLECMTLLIKSGDADVNIEDRLGRTALMQSVMLNRLDAVRLLLDSGANPAMVAKNGKTALDMAKEKGKDQIAALLTASLNKTMKDDKERRDGKDTGKDKVVKADKPSAKTVCDTPSVVQLTDIKGNVVDIPINSHPSLQTSPLPPASVSRVIPVMTVAAALATCRAEQYVEALLAEDISSLEDMLCLHDADWDALIPSIGARRRVQKWIAQYK